MGVKIIPGHKRIPGQKSSDNPINNVVTDSKERNADSQKLRVAAYCRVSTDLDDQESSYEAQVEHYTLYIKSHEGWAFAGIYADEGISGTDHQQGYV